MYQSVDDIEEEAKDGEVVKQTTSRPRRVFYLLLSGMALLAAIAFFLPKSDPPGPDELESVDEVYAVYSKALSEPQPALRRARLLDFINNYPEHDRVGAAKAQLSVIQKADDEAWFSLQEIIFDPAQSQPMKLAALDLYDDIWSSMLLGGREDDVRDMRARLGANDSFDGLPSSDDTETNVLLEGDPEKQDFTPPPDIFDPSIDGTQLAGGNPDYETVNLLPMDSAPVENLRPGEAVIEPVRLREDRQPKYPSRALRKGVQAEVVLLLSIDDEGEVEKTEVISASARRYRKDFIKAAERAAMRTRYDPKRINGRAVATTGIIKKYKFVIED